MITIDGPVDDEILAAITYFREWRISRNALLLFDALGCLNRAEHAWIASRGRTQPLRREWQVLRRCVMRGLGRLHGPLTTASSPAQIARAIFPGKRGAPLARYDQLNALLLDVALRGSTIDQAMQFLASIGQPLSRGYLVRMASTRGLTPRSKAAPGGKRARGKARRDTATGQREDQIAPGNRRYRTR
ncbi:hypothetical protein [Burkholderia glumae]|uniref:hypothetical protein n=1 Tax=Burkholderia glumae TaxID=337 RepID=UPI00156F864F|nr:hypothetical protein [Burkholderia glumae]NVE22369.1 hypothetical protein [Burkholderia glumae]